MRDKMIINSPVFLHSILVVSLIILTGITSCSDNYYDLYEDGEIIDGIYWENGRDLWDSNYGDCPFQLTQQCLVDKIDGIFYHQPLDVYSNDPQEKTVHVVSVYEYLPETTSDHHKGGGWYTGNLVIPDTVYFPWLCDSNSDIPKDGHHSSEGFIQGKFPVVGIRDMYRNGLKSLSLPETIEWIDHTIEKCRYLEKIHLNNSLKELQGIRDCPRLAECNLPDSLECIGDGWMSGIAITKVEFPSKLIAIGNEVFSDNPKLNDLSLGNLIEAGDGCFRNLASLEEITLPISLKKLGNNSFSNCPKLRKIVFLSGNCNFGDECFSNCQNVKEVYCHSKEPFAFPYHFLSGKDTEECVLYVPKGSEEAYRQKWGNNWRGDIKSLP